jgi:ubiquinone/menaquinone biosynthesis C-methylase UbiE
MIRLFNILIALVTSFGIFAHEPGHEVSGTNYEKKGSLAYAKNRHGPDGALFLDPYFIPYLLNLEGQHLLDAGCGSAPWAIYAAENGATVVAIDIQQNMIDLAEKAVKEAGVDEKVTLLVGDVAELPCPPDAFDRALSINVGCNLPSTIQLLEKMVGLGPHLQEIARVLKKNGRAIVTAPASFGIVFTNGVPKEAVLKHIAKVLAELPHDPTASEITTQLNQLEEVYRATFAIKNGKLTLITDENELEPGEDIWRKLPGLTVPNRYHSESEYLEEFANANLTVEACYRPQFQNSADHLKYNASQPSSHHLGPEYIEHHPFVIFCLKQSSEE